MTIDMFYIGEQVGKPYTNKSRARSHADKLDIVYGAIRYSVREIKA